jgi:hypothetical protein
MSVLQRYLFNFRTQLPLLGLSAGIVLGSLILGMLLVVGEIRLAVAVSILLALVGLATINIRFGILGLFVYLTVMGDLRRMLVPIAGWSGTDPLLLIAPVTTLFLFATALLSNRLALDSWTARVIAIFMGFMTLQIFNPVQGGLMVGIAGAMLYLVPMFWYWIGRAYATQQFIHLWFYRVMPTLAVLAALMGLYQFAYGWLPYQLEWFRIAGYSSLGPSEDLLRSISIFPNLTAYLHYLGIVIVAGMAALFRRDWRYAPLILFLFAALFLAGSRGPILMLVIVTCLLFTVQGRSVAIWAPRLAVTLLLGGIFLVWGLSQAGEVSQRVGHDRASHVLNRQANLLPSEDGKGGTVAIHGNLFYLGLKWGFEQPLGRGIGSTTLAGSKFGTTGGSTEKDLTDMFVSGGVVGGFLYLAIILLVATQAVRYWHAERSLIALAMVGILAFLGLSWLKSGQYVLTPLVWLTIGALDRFSTYRQGPSS